MSTQIESITAEMEAPYSELPSPSNCHLPSKDGYFTTTRAVQEQPTIPIGTESALAQIASQTGNDQRVFQATTQPATNHRLIVTILIVASNFMQISTNAFGIAGGQVIAEQLGSAVGPGKSNWVAASYPLTQGTFVLVSGRLGAIYGHKNATLIGGLWFTIWTFANGFCTNFAAFNVARAMCGIGGALIMPNTVALISTMLPPGRMRNISLGFFAASAPIGGFLGALITGIFIEFGNWQWTFFAFGALGVIIFSLLAWMAPKDKAVDPAGRMDYIGAILGTSGLIIFNFVWNQAPAVGWSTPYESVLIVVSLLLLLAFVIWESKGAVSPIMPLDIWTSTSFKALILVELLVYMSFGTNIWYMVLWEQNIRSMTPLQFAIGWTPFVVASTIGAFLAAWLIPRMAAQWIIAIGAFSVILCNVLIATMPEQQTYWAQVFPATVVGSFCPDFVYTAGQIIASNSVKRSQQGIAASMMGTLNLYGNSLGLGFAGTIETEVIKYRNSTVLGYRAALWFGATLGLIALVVDLLFVRMVKDDREGWQHEEDERAAQEDLIELSVIVTATGRDATGVAA